MDTVPSLAILAGIGIAIWLLLSVTVQWLTRRAQAENAAADEQRRADSARWIEWRASMEEAEQAAVQGMTYDELVTAARDDPDVGFAALDALKEWSFDRSGVDEAFEIAARTNRESALRKVRHLRQAHPEWSEARDDHSVSSIASERQRERKRQQAERHRAQLVAEEQAAARLGITVAEYRHRQLVDEIGWWFLHQRQRRARH